VARPTITIPPVTILLEMIGHSSLTDGWLGRCRRSMLEP
jgi:hypothetical protein